MKEYPIENAYQHETLLFYKTDWLKLCVTIFAPANVYFVVKKNGNTFYFYGIIDKSSFDTRIRKRQLPCKEFDWDNVPVTITTKVFKPDEKVNEESSNAIHTDNAIQY